MLAVSRAVAGGGALSTLLDVIAEQAAGVVDALAASILLLRDHERFRLAGVFGLSTRYCAYLESEPIARGKGPSGLVLRHGLPVLIEDAQRDPRLGVANVARKEARYEGFRAMGSVPLRGPTELLGVLHVYRGTTGPWPSHQVDLLTYFAEHAAHAIRVASLVEQQQRQIGATTQLVDGLRYQTHEYANRLHAISGLLALGKRERLQALVADLELRHHRSYEAVMTRIDNAAVAGLLLAHMAIAQQRGVELRLDLRSRLGDLPSRLGDVEAITIVGNLIQNAFDAVAGAPRTRRRVTVLIGSTSATTTFSVRDWGKGLARDAEEWVFEPGATSKRDHAGIGLSLVESATSTALGSIAVTRHAAGTTVKVTIPNG